jgi:SHS2 domain-containing protein
MQGKTYKVFDHTADIGVEIFGQNMEALFCHAALAVFDLITDVQTGRATKKKRVEAEGDDREDLLINFLREVLYFVYGKGWLFKTCRIVKMEERRLVAELEGEIFDAGRHEIKTEIKAVTYHQVLVEQTSKEWRGRVIFDV